MGCDRGTWADGSLAGSAGGGARCRELPSLAVQYLWQFANEILGITCVGGRRVEPGGTAPR